MTDPDDRELEQYLKGGSKLSARYREASGETAPPELDEVILAQARAAARRKGAGVNRYLAPVALAASLVLAVNLAWNLYQVEPPSRPAPVAAPPAEADAAAPVPAAPPAATEPAPAPAQRRERERMAAQAKAEERTTAERKAAAAPPPEALLQSADSAGAAAAAPAEAATLTDAQKIDRLIAHIASLEGAVFIRNGKEHGPAEAAKHLSYKRDKAGKRVRTADDFIRLCASHSYLSGEAYLIRFADGRTRTAEDVLREELSRIEGR